jgi:hypothetical protein
MDIPDPPEAPGASSSANPVPHRCARPPARPPTALVSVPLVTRHVVWAGTAGWAFRAPIERYAPRRRVSTHQWCMSEGITEDFWLIRSAAPSTPCNRHAHYYEDLVMQHVSAAHPNPRCRGLTPPKLPQRPRNRGMDPPEGPGGSTSTSRGRSRCVSPPGLPHTSLPHCYFSQSRRQTRFFRRHGGMGRLPRLLMATPPAARSARISDVFWRIIPKNFSWLAPRPPWRRVGCSRIPPLNEYRRQSRQSGMCVGVVWQRAAST